ncbi:vacuolar import and degradation protein-domain-containing protein [Xylariales sp. PMI_506]|nr:vacuolar import and degradation protein-domain-containing protein [Xylariales sp. PMI_506]
MPTPSSNPPPELPSRSHNSSCPDDLRTPITSSSWRPSHDGGVVQEMMQVDNDSTAASGNGETEPTQAGQVAAPVELIRIRQEMDIVTGSPSRSMTDSPRPDSRSEGEIIAQDSDPSSQSTKTDNETGMESGARDGELRGLSDRSSGAAYDMVSPASIECDKTADESALSHGRRIQDDYTAPSMGYEWSNVRISPTTTSSYLRPGSKFTGTQQSERQIYEVQVELKYVDLRESFLCGYLKIQGLTEDNPTLTTYFEGEIIGSRYSFLTNHPAWGASADIDFSHWSKFASFRPYAKQMKKGGNVLIPNLANKDTIFMRWKEHFLVPDHRVRTINGASFEGFYYICFNQKEGKVEGIYFHAKSERFQQLELEHVPDRGCFGAMEFR